MYCYQCTKKQNVNENNRKNKIMPILSRFNNELNDEKCHNVLVENTYCDDFLSK